MMTTIEEQGLCTAARKGSNVVIQWLIDQGVSANAIDIVEGGALYTSVTFLNVDSARLLLENKTKINSIRSEESPLHYIIRA